HVLGLGAMARVHGGQEQVTVSSYASEGDRFGDLLECLWDDMRVVSHEEAGADPQSLVEANFSDPSMPGQVDTFEGASRGRGWVTPWIASGNPVAEVRHADSLDEEGSPYLRVGFKDSHDRTIGREYGRRGHFDPNRPHVIS